MAYPGVVFDVSERTETETSAQLDLDGDGVPEKISLHPAEPVTGYSLEQYTIYLNLGLSQMNCYDLQDAVLETADGHTVPSPDSGQHGKYEQFDLRFQPGRRTAPDRIV